MALAATASGQRPQRFATQAIVMTAARDDPGAVVRRIGPALVFERLWGREKRAGSERAKRQ